MPEAMMAKARRRRQQLQSPQTMRALARPNLLLEWTPSASSLFVVRVVAAMKAIHLRL
jgi:hypothetical protein